MRQSENTEGTSCVKDCIAELGIIAIDDDAAVLERIKRFVSEVENTEYLGGFTEPSEGVAYVAEHKVDLVFLAVAMLRVQGLEVARQIQGMNRPPAIAFVTRAAQYSYDAWKTDAVDYILKPFKKSDLERAIYRARQYKLVKELELQGSYSRKKIYIKCFPSFDVFVDGDILEFTYGKVKELLAFLVYQQGNWSSIDQIVVYVLENHDERSGKEYYRTLIYRLKKILGKYGIGHILETGYGKARVNPAYFTCEYYQYIEGKQELFHDTFMGAYGWAGDAAAYMAEKIVPTSES